MPNGGSREAEILNKMKTFRVIGMALFAVLLSVGLASCSKDDEPESEKINLTGTAWSQNGDDDIVCFNPNGVLVFWDSYPEYKVGNEEEGVYEYARWSIEGHVLSIIESSHTEYWNIISYSSKQMVLERLGTGRQWIFTRVN